MQEPRKWWTRVRQRGGPVYYTFYYLFMCSVRVCSSAGVVMDVVRRN
jgi:hypothetical protein